MMQKRLPEWAQLQICQQSPVFTFCLQSLNFVIFIMIPQLLIVLSDVRGRKETLSTVFSCCVLYPSFPLQGIVR